MVYGELNPRIVKSDDFFGIQVMNLQALSLVYESTFAINLYQNYQQLQKNNGTINICNID
jgi:hypothetical protein